MSLSKSIKSDEELSDKEQEENNIKIIKKKIKKTISKKDKDQLKITHFFQQLDKKEENQMKTQISMEKQSSNKQIQQLQLILQQLTQEEMSLEKVYEQEKIMLEEQKQFISSYKKKSKYIISQSLKDIYAYRRQQKKKINSDLGYNKINTKTFIEGSKINQISNKIKYLQSIIKSNTLKPSQSIFIKKQINELNQQLDRFNNLFTVYKENIKLANEENNCKLNQQKWPIIQKRYLPLQLLGKGGFSQVYKCYDLVENCYIALKLSCINSFVTNPSAKEQYLKHIQRQTQTHKLLHHRNIAKLKTVIEIDSETIAIIMEYCSGPQLSKYLKSRKLISQIQAKPIIYSILDALSYLNRLPTKIIHYDLKPPNIIFNDGIVKILDFGLCKLIDNQDSHIALTSQGVGTYWYLPPQTFQDNSPKISNKVDIWSIGVIFYEIIYGKRPFGHNMSQRKILKDGIILNAFNVEFPQNQTITQECQNFIKSCLRYQPSERLDPQQAFNHPYFDDIRITN